MPCNFHCVVTAHEELRRVTVPRASQCPRESWVATYQPCCTTASKSQHIKIQKGCAGKGCWPHPQVRSLSWGGPGAHCRYPEDRVPRVQASSQDNGSRLPAKGSSEAAMCPRGSGSRSRLGAAPGPLCVTWAPAPTFWRRAAPELPRVTWVLRAASK
jgi:hypothetical protein